jgi:Flp pilus assembly pilin Flp
MFDVGKFVRDERGTTIHSISLMAGAIAIAALTGTHFLDKAVKDGAFDSGNGGRFAQNTANIPRAGAVGSGASRQVTLDYTPTGSIPNNLAQPIILDPCTGIRK